MGHLIQAVTDEQTGTAFGFAGASIQHPIVYLLGKDFTGSTACLILYGHTILVEAFADGCPVTGLGTVLKGKTEKISGRSVFLYGDIL